MVPVPALTPLHLSFTPLHPRYLEFQEEQNCYQVSCQVQDQLHLLHLLEAHLHHQEKAIQYLQVFCLRFIS